MKFVDMPNDNEKYGIISEMQQINYKEGIGEVSPLFDIEIARNMGVALKGDKVTFLNENGYDWEREKFASLGLTELTVKYIHIDSYTSDYQFEEVPGKWNTVMFAKNKS